MSRKKNTRYGEALEAILIQSNCGHVQFLVIFPIAFSIPAIIKFPPKKSRAISDPAWVFGLRTYPQIIPLDKVPL